MIASQFRPDFWIGKIGTFLGATLLSGFLYYLSFKNGAFDYMHYWFWSATLIWMWVGMRAYRFLFDELKTITVSETGISIRYFLSEPAHVEFQSIKTMKLQKVMGVRGRSRSATMSHHELLITLHDENTICFDGYQYKNFAAVKSMIYHYVYHGEQP